jgi:hypothetical protein
MSTSIILRGAGIGPRGVTGRAVVKGGCKKMRKSIDQRGVIGL